MDMKEEVMNDAMDDAMEDEGDEEETYEQIIFIIFVVHYESLKCVVVLYAN